jgi:hypothetical protein
MLVGQEIKVKMISEAWEKQGFYVIAEGIIQELGEEASDILLTGPATVMVIDDEGDMVMSESIMKSTIMKFRNTYIITE